MIKADELKTTWTIEDVLTTNGLIEEHAPKSGQIHVLVVIPKLLSKRPRVDGDDGLSVQSKKRKMGDEDNGDDRVLRYFTMAGFPPLEHPRTLYKTIMERDSYIVIFRELMRKVKMCFKDKSDSNIVVTGNPGTGKSRFYLYCIFQLIRCHRVEVQELSSFELVLNCNNNFQVYQPDTKEFVYLSVADVKELMTRGRVLRLTDGTSSMLCGWHGVSILFAAPDTPRMSNYAKVESFKYIMPAWSLEELQDYNSLLSDKLELPDDVLISRYKKFGGIPRYIFTWTERGNVEEQRRAIASCNAQDMISYVSRKLPVPVNSRDHSDSILVMVPSEIPSGGCVQVQMISGRHIPRYDIRRHQELPM